MSNLQVIHHYKEHDVYRRSFGQLATEVFGCGDIEHWYQAGWWSDDFFCYSYIDDQTVVANMSGYKVHFLSEGKRINALQTCFGMTHPAYRKQGLCEHLFKLLTQIYTPQCEMLYTLTAHESIKHLHLKYGFSIQPQREFFFTPPDKTKALRPEKRWKRKLDMANEDDVQTLMTFAQGRIPVSNTFHVANAHHLLFLCCLGTFKDYIYVLPENDAIVIYKREKDTLHIYDLLFRKEISLRDILENLLEEGVKEGVFYFTPPEWSDIPIRCRDLQAPECLLTKPCFTGFAGKSRYPILA